MIGRRRLYPLSHYTTIICIPSSQGQSDPGIIFLMVCWRLGIMQPSKLGWRCTMPPGPLQPNHQRVSLQHQCTSLLHLLFVDLFWSFILCQDIHCTLLFVVAQQWAHTLCDCRRMFDEPYLFCILFAWTYIGFTPTLYTHIPFYVISLLMFNITWKKKKEEVDHGPSPFFLPFCGLPFRSTWISHDNYLKNILYKIYLVRFCLSPIVIFAPWSKIPKNISIKS